MKRMLLKLVVSCLLVVFAATGAFALKLEYKFKEGDVSRYKVREKVTCNKTVMMLNPSSDWDAVLVVKVSKVLENGDAEIKASYESGTLKMQGQTHKITPDEVAPVTVTVSKNGEIRDLEALERADGGVGVTVKSPDGGDMSVKTDVYQNVLRSLLQALPAKEIKEGDTWKQDIASPSMTGTTAAQCTLQKAGGSYQGIKVASVLSTVEEKAPASPVGGVGEVKEKSTLLFATEQGKVASVKDSGQVVMRGVEVPKNEEGDMVKLDLTISFATDISLIVAGGK